LEKIRPPGKKRELPLKMGEIKTRFFLSLKIWPGEYSLERVPHKGVKNPFPSLGIKKSPFIS